MSTPQQQSMEEHNPSFSLGTTFMFNGKKYYQKPLTKGAVAKALCCPMCYPLEDKYYENKDEYLSYRLTGCNVWPCCETLRFVIKHDNKDVGELIPARLCTNGCVYAMGCKCSGEVILATIKVNGTEKYTIRQFLECCSCCKACCEKPCIGKCCCKPTWQVTEQPVYGPQGTEAKPVGWIKNISHHFVLQDVIVCMEDGADLEAKATLTAVPWLTVLANSMGAGSFLDPGSGMNTTHNLKINRKMCTFEQMLGSIHSGEHVGGKGAVTYK